MLDILIENPDLFLEDIGNLNFLDKRICFSKRNTEILGKLSHKLSEETNSKNCSESELWQMEKIYLLYPEHLPEKLQKLPWDQVKILINILSEEKREFYVDDCLRYSWDNDTLKEYILNDLFEKYIFLRDKKMILLKIY